eukprot:12861342-Alexandrium_andersonii.AAC.1
MINLLYLLCLRAGRACCPGGGCGSAPPRGAQGIGRSRLEAARSGLQGCRACAAVHGVLVEQGAGS